VRRIKLTDIAPGDEGNNCFGRGRSPYTGRDIENKHGRIEKVETKCGVTVISVLWDGERKIDMVAQANVVGTGM
jgi:hypothetical protein